MAKSIKMSLTTFRSSEENKAYSKGFVAVPGIKARRYYNPSTRQEISVRQYQKMQKGLDLTNSTTISSTQVAQYNVLRSQHKSVVQQQKFYGAISAGNEGKSVKESLKAGGISKQTFERLREQQGKDVGYSYKNGVPSGIFSNYASQFAIPSFNEHGQAVLRFEIFDRVNASRMGQYQYAIDQALQGNQDLLNNFGNPIVVNSRGDVIILITDIDAIELYLRSLTSEEREEYDAHIYQLIKGTSTVA